MDPRTQDELSLALLQKLNELQSRAGWQRTNDIGVDWLVRDLVPSATSLKTDWSKPFRVDRPSVFQLLNAGVDATHTVYLSKDSPDDTTVSEGRCRRNDVGRGFCLQVGDWYAYVPLAAGDPAKFTARISDASSDLPSQNAAIEGGGAAPGTLVVSTLNRAAFATAQKNVTTPGTAVNLASLVVPDGFALVVKGKPLNAGFIWVGNSQANAQDHTVAYPLDSGEPNRFYVKNANLLWIDADVATEGVNISVEQ